MRGLVVVLDALAAFAEATGTSEPRLAAVAALAELAGAEAVRVGVSEAFRPVDDVAVRDLRRVVRRLELRIAPTPTLLKLALDARPERVVLAGTAPPALLQPRPFEPRHARVELAPLVRTLREAGIEVTVSLAPDLDAAKLAHAAEVDALELFTGDLVDLPAAERRAGLERLGDAATLAAKLRLPVCLGGGLDRRSLPRMLEAAPVAQSVAVGRGLAAHALLFGLERAVRQFAAGLG